MIHRHIDKQIFDLLRYFPTLVVTGARQTGKTTLLRTLLSDYAYVTLDLPSSAEQAEHDPDLFFRLHPAPLIIDEIQYAPALFRHLKARIDEDRHRMGAYVLTGSQKFVLMKGISDSLAGRAAFIELEGLSHAECHGLEGFRLDRYLQRGGFPELWRVGDLPEGQFFSAYMATYLERDVRQILNIGSLRNFERFIRLLATRNGQQAEISGIARDIGISAKTAVAWLSVLEASNQISLLEPWYGNVGKRIVKTPKLYFRDTGLLCWLLGIGAESLAQSPFVGTIWETAVYAELRRETLARGLNRQFYYYRDNQGTEVDFLVLGDGARLIECKWTETPKRDDARGIARLSKLAESVGSPELRDRTAFILSRTNAAYPIDAEGLRVEAVGIHDAARVLE